MQGIRTIQVQGRQLESGEWAMWAEGENGARLPVHELRVGLFAWHHRSFYGATLKQGVQELEHALLLSPWAAAEYLAAPAAMLHLPVEWSGGLELAGHAARVFLEALEKGWYVPDSESWQKGTPGWRLMLPEEKERAFAELREQASGMLIDVDAWFSSALVQLIREEASVTEAWEELVAEVPQLQELDEEERETRVSGFMLSEDEWLTAVEWKKDEVPFRTCFQLVEPDGSDLEDWRLRLVLQDKQRAGFLVESEPGVADVLAVTQLPEEWKEQVEKRIPGHLERLLGILPELESASGEVVSDLSDEMAWDFLNEGSLKLLQAGYSVMLPAWWEELKRQKPRLKAKLKSSVGSARSSMFGLDQIIQFDWKIAMGGVELSEEEFLQITAEKKRLLFIRGRWVQLDPAFLKQLQQAMKRVEKDGLTFREVMELHLLGTPEGAQDGGEQEELLRIEVELNKHVAEIMHQLEQTERIPIAEPSAMLQADLRRYQKEGMSWLLFMRRFGLGACLADDMGLGKTVQFIAYLLGAKEQDQAAGRPQTAPALLICPTSVLGNWQKELERFAPSMRVHLHYGPQRAKGEDFAASIAGYDLVMTSYTLAQLDEQELSSVRWQSIGLDEAQNIKNAYTKQSSAIRKLEAGHRIALTGTPIENRLTELWSIFDFMNPGYLGTLNEFAHKFVNPIEKSGDTELVAQVQRLIRPFLLRRVKKDPAIQLDLPDKTESKAYVSLSVEQASLYENVVESLMNRIDELTGMEKKGLILATLTKLKQICDHPALYLKEQGAATLGEEEGRSPKVTRLLEMIDELRSEGDKCLIFTQFVEMGMLLQGILERELGQAVPFLHGGVPKKKRDEMIAQFQEPGSGRSRDEASGVFILSLKAGGTGLNLTEANHVFHFDRWWNPAVENQATDRAFRIGQTRNVQVHKFVTLGTLEERIDEMIEKKSGLSRQIVGAGENWVTEMSTGELRELFSLRREWIGK
ncbi:DEAD/DEAH box helicase [Paenibacillus silviterrae]|uniref:DEAD/DEAH box helicase n=1 Tax=Paenibacillus silviterrae TaxID=3242194 RepID=UPI00254279D8|nr:DEAD/DEAH box helicase [Paenibacillus chinjuensis]